MSATGSAGTIGAGDYLKEHFGTRIVAAEALECPTLLENGFGEHNIQGIGDKHVPLIHNVMNTDVVAAISDQATDRLGVVFQSAAGREFLARRHGVPADVLATLSSFGLSSICNVLAAIKTAEKLGLGANDVIITVATDGDRMYGSEHTKTLAEHFPNGIDEKVAEREIQHWLYETRADHVLELTEQDRRRIFNLGAATWVEQRGVTLEHFTERADQKFWKGLHAVMPHWNAMIEEFNAPARGAGAPVIPFEPLTRLRCIACGAGAGRSRPVPFRCPHADGVETARAPARERARHDARAVRARHVGQPFVRHRELLHSSYARAGSA